jgi:hypothetical protein
MAFDDIYVRPIFIDQLMLSKALGPLPDVAIAELAKIEALDVSNFYEQEVRSFVIDPIVRLLGYDKGTDFSVDLDRPIEFLNKKKVPDYKFHLWKENFWLIEAKRPLPENEKGFGYDVLAQALEYAVHPSINAALVVLCNGARLEIFDREVSVTEPILCVEKAGLRRDFNKIRALLEPMQVGFFEKRCVVRLLGLHKDESLRRPRAAALAQRFYYGDTSVFEDLCDGYGIRKDLYLEDG